MSMGYIRRRYGVPAKRGARVRYQPSADERSARGGRIVSARGHYLRVLLDGDDCPRLFHPTWALTYLERSA